MSEIIKPENETKDLQPVRLESSTEVLIRLASDKDFPVEKLAQLIELKNREEDRAAKIEFDLNFAKMQGEIPSFKRSKTGHRYKYVPIEDYMSVLRPLLAKYNFSCTWYQESIEGKVRIWNVISGYGHEKKCYIDLAIVAVSDMTNDIQDTGSAKTYGRRYTLKDNLGLVEEDEDDDGASAGKPHRDNPPPQKKSESPKKTYTKKESSDSVEYQTIMRLINTRHKNQAIFLPKELVDRKKAADAVRDNPDELKQQIDVLTGIINNRKAKLDETTGGTF